MCARVLVVDDDRVNADLLGYLLRAFGHDAVLALAGAEALREADARVPDLVLCDIQMPEIDGFEVVRRLRADGRFSATPIVGVTALAMVGDREKVLAAGFDGYLSKPIAPETFMADIARYLPEGSVTDLPSPGPSGHPLPQGGRGQPEGPRGYALVVDDIEANVTLMRHLIGSLGFEVRAARNAADALLLAHAALPVIIISDIHMPGASGIDLLETAKSDDALKGIPFFLVSSSPATADELRRSAIADGFMLRPLDAEAMLQRLAKWIPAEPRR